MVDDILIEDSFVGDDDELIQPDIDERPADTGGISEEPDIDEDEEELDDF